MQLTGTVGSFKASLAAQLFLKMQHSFLVCCNDLEEATYFYADLQNFIETNDVYLWVDSFRKNFEIQKSDTAKIQSKTAVLDALSAKKRPAIVVSYPAALIEKIIEQNELSNTKLKFKVGETVDLDFLIELFETYNFERQDFVYEAGHYAIRGGIIDFFSFSA